MREGSGEGSEGRDGGKTNATKKIARERRIIKGGKARRKEVNKLKRIKAATENDG